MSRIVVINAKIVLTDKVIPHGSLVIKDNKIIEISKDNIRQSGATEIDAKGNFVAPGFIDLHVHGDIEKISVTQAKGGTTSFLATLHPEKPKVLLKSITQAKEKTSRATGAKVLGLRLEGPFINKSYSGALPKTVLRNPDLLETEKIITLAGNTLKMVVLAPELKDALKVIQLLGRHGILSSIGHTGATYEEAEEAIGAGAVHATHVFNRMRGFDQRNPGALGAVLLDTRVMCEIIADGVHVHPAALKLLLRCKGLDRITVVTDSTEAQVYPPKRRAGVVFKLLDGTMYGSALTLNKAVKNIAQVLNLEIFDAIKLVTINPATTLGIEKRKGSLKVDKDADVVIFDQNFNVKTTIVEGKIVFSE